MDRLCCGSPVNRMRSPSILRFLYWELGYNLERVFSLASTCQGTTVGLCSEMATIRLGAWGPQASHSYWPLPALWGGLSLNPLLSQEKFLYFIFLLQSWLLACLSEQHNYTKDDLDFQRPLWGTPDLNKRVHLKGTFENKNSQAQRIVLFNMQRPPN